MPNQSNISAFARDYLAQFAAGFVTTAMAVAAVYATFPAPALHPGEPHPEIARRLSFATSMASHLPSARLPDEAVTGPASSGAFNERSFRASVSPALQAAAYEIAGRFTDPSPAAATTPDSPPLILASSSEAIEAPVTATTPVAATAGGTAPALARSSQPTVQLNVTRSHTSATRVAFPLDLNPSWAEKPEAGLMIGGLPEGVTLSAGRQTALGLWKLLSADAKSAQLIVSRGAPARFELTVLLLDTEGLVVTGIELVVSLRDADPAMRQHDSSTAAALPHRAGKRNGAGHGLTVIRHKVPDARQAAQRTRHVPVRQTAILLKSDSPANAWTLQGSKNSSPN